MTTEHTALVERRITDEELSVIRPMYAETYPVRPLLNELDALRAEVAALKAQIDQQHEDLDHFLSGAAGDLPKIAALRKQVETMQHVVNCASALTGTDEGEIAGEDDEDMMEQLFEAVRDYHTALADKPLSGPTP